MCPKKQALLVVTLACSVFSSDLLAESEVFDFRPSVPLSFSEGLLEYSEPAPRTVFSSAALVFGENADHIPDSAGLVDRTHTIFSRSFRKFFHQIDDYFSDGKPAAQSNQSWARVRLDTLRSATQDRKFKPSIKLRVVLPRAEKRFRLLFSTEDEEVVQGTPSQGTQVTDSESNGFSLALRFMRQARKNGTVNFDLGTRYRDKKAQIFSRINFFYGHDLKWNFRSSFRNSLYYYSASGYENKFRYDLTRPLNDNESVFIRGSTELLWKKNQRGTVVGETVGVYSDIDANRAVAVEALASYTTALNGDQTEKFLGAEFRIRFRHNVWRRWFYYEVWPTMRWAPENDYAPSFGGLVRVEMILGSL